MGFQGCKVLTRAIICVCVGGGTATKIPEKIQVSGICSRSSTHERKVIAIANNVFYVKQIE